MQLSPWGAARPAAAVGSPAARRTPRQAASAHSARADLARGCSSPPAGDELLTCPPPTRRPFANFSLPLGVAGTSGPSTVPTAHACLRTPEHPGPAEEPPGGERSASPLDPAHRRGPRTPLLPGRSPPFPPGEEDGVGNAAPEDALVAGGRGDYLLRGTVGLRWPRL